MPKPLTLLVVVSLIVPLLPIPLTGQSPNTESWTTPRTSWGDPDLHGIWTANEMHSVPLERTDSTTGSETLSGEAAAARREQTTERTVNAEGIGNYDRAFRDTALGYTKQSPSIQASLIVDPPNGRRPPFTSEAQQRRAETREYNLALLQSTDACKSNRPGCPPYGPPSPRRAESPPHYLTTEVNRSDNPEDRSLSERCMGARLPDFGGEIAGFFLQIIQSPGTVSIFYDTGQGQGWQRTIPITDHPHLPPSVRQWQGDSRGHWDNDTLVVDVTNFSPKTDFHGSREHLHLVERWTRLDAETIGYSATMDDPTTWTSPWTVELELNLQSNKANRIYHEPRCHEGNYGLPGLLAGARAEDRAFAEGRGPDPATLCIAGAAAECGGFGGGFAESGTETDPLR